MTADIVNVPGLPGSSDGPSGSGRGMRKFLAASVPRYIRMARLPHLSTRHVIGSWRGKQGRDESLVYDVIMLPELEFNRACVNLGLQNSGSPSLDMTRLTPAYIPQDTREVLIPADEKNPQAYARARFWGKDWLNE